AGIPAPDPRLLRGSEGRRQTGRAHRRRGLQPLRDAGDVGQSLRRARPRGAGADAARRRGVTGAFVHAVTPQWAHPPHARRPPRRPLAAAPPPGGGGHAWAHRPPQPPRVKGPLVWLDMDQQDLDDAYDQLVYAPNRDHILKRCARNSELARERLGTPKRFAYGATAMEALDVFTTKVPNAPVNVFVHGGAWRAGLAINYAYAAEMFVNAGAHHVVLDFNNVLETGGDLMVMADQVRRAVAWVYRNAKSFGGDAERL